MKEFLALRIKAKQRRNAAIELAKSEYEATLIQIATLEQGLLARVPTKPRSIAACIDSIIPREGKFTYLDIVKSLEALDPGRLWKERTIHCHLSKLREKGIIRRLRRATSTSYTLYVRAECNAQVQPLDDTPLKDVIRSVLTTPMSATEIMVAVTAAGYRSTMSPRKLQRYIGRCCGRAGLRG